MGRTNFSDDQHRLELDLLHLILRVSTRPPHSFSCVVKDPCTLLACPRQEKFSPRDFEETIDVDNGSVDDHPKGVPGKDHTLIHQTRPRQRVADSVTPVVAFLQILASLDLVPTLSGKKQPAFIFL